MLKYVDIFNNILKLISSISFYYNVAIGKILITYVAHIIVLLDSAGLEVHVTCSNIRVESKENL